MKVPFVIVAAAFGLVGEAGSAVAQPYGNPYYDYRGRDYEYRERDYEDRGRGPGRRERVFAFDERGYLRCHRDVRRAVARGEFESGFEHYQRFGRREGRQSFC